MPIYGYPRENANTGPDLSTEPLITWDLPTANLTNSKLITPGTGIAIQVSGGNVTIIATGSSGTVPGTVYDFSAGNLSPVFTTAVASSTTTPDLSFTLVNQACGRVFVGPQTGANAAPTFRRLAGDDLVQAIQAGSNMTVTNLGSALLLISSDQYTGTVTSVGLALPSIFSVSNSPVTTTGTLTGTLVTQACLSFFAGPSAGAASTPAFRGIIGNDLAAAIAAGSNVSLSNNGSTLTISVPNALGGTVTNVGVGNLQPVFTSSTSNPTTTPSTSFTLVQQPCVTFFRGPSSGANGDPWFGRITGNDLPIVAGTNTTVTNNGATIQVNAPNALGGTVTSVSAGDSPIFTTTETNPTTTPNITFTLVNKPSATAFMGPSAGAAGEPWFRVFTGNDLVDAVRAGSNITITNNGDYISIASTASGGGGGTVTDFSAGNLSPLFTSNVATSTTTPALTFTLTSQTSGKFFSGPSTGSAAAPTFRNIVGQDIFAALEAGSNISLVNMGSTVKITASDQFTGTVTSVSVGNLSPLFTANTANPTTTPSTTYTLVNQPCNLVFIGPASGPDAAPTFRGVIGNDLAQALVNGTNSVVVNNGNTIQVNVPNALGGTVTSFSAGDFNPLFTTTETNPTTTPALSFTAVQQACGLVFVGPPSGANANPGFRGLIGNDLSLALVAGTNTTVTNNGNTIQVNASDQFQGTVTSVAVGNLAPVFTSNTSNPTTTPSTTFTLASQPPNTFFRAPSSQPAGVPWFGLITGNDLASAIVAGTNTTVTNNGSTFQINGNAGTVTSFSAGDFSPLFTTTESTPTTTPALSFSAITQDPNLFFCSGPSGSAAAPGFRGVIGNDLAAALVNGTNTTVVNNGNTIQVNAADQYTGTVTNVAVGNLVPLFTSNTTNPTSTPSTSFTLSNAPPNSFWRGPSSQPAGQPWYGILTGNDLASAVVAGTNTTVTNNGATIQINGNAGTVTSVAVGNLSPLWTANTATSTTTPNTTFTQVNAPSGTFLRGPSSGADSAYWFGKITGNDLAGVITAGSNITLTNNGATLEVAAAGGGGGSNTDYNNSFLLMGG